VNDGETPDMTFSRLSNANPHVADDLLKDQIIGEAGEIVFLHSIESRRGRPKQAGEIRRGLGTTPRSLIGFNFLTFAFLPVV
jgi:hypothetical protein